jgi:hypothetical protein
MSSASPLVALQTTFLSRKQLKQYTKSTRTSKIFSDTELLVPFGCVKENACGGELGSISLQNNSSKRKARHFVLTKMVLDRVAESMTRNKKTRIAGFRKERVPFSS